MVLPFIKLKHIHTYTEDILANDIKLGKHHDAQIIELNIWNKVTKNSDTVFSDSSETQKQLNALAARISELEGMLAGCFIYQNMSYIEKSVREKPNSVLMKRSACTSVLLYFIKQLKLI